MVNASVDGAQNVGGLYVLRRVGTQRVVVVNDPVIAALFRQMAQGKQRDDAERVRAHRVAVAVHVPPHMHPSAVRWSHIEAAVRQLEEVPRTAQVSAS